MVSQKERKRRPASRHGQNPLNLRPASVSVQNGTLGRTVLARMHPFEPILVTI
jgi:hypothetical protein